MARRQGGTSLIVTATLAFWVLAACALTAPAVAVAVAATAPGRAIDVMRGGGESQIDETATDQSPPASVRPAGPTSLQERLRDYVEGSLTRYDALKNESAGFRRQGWFPSLFLREPGSDVVIEPGADGKVTVTVHISYARRDLDQRLVIAPAGRFELPGADQRFFAEVIAGLATAAAEIDRARLRFWFATLRADGQMSWELRGGIALSAAAASRFPAGKRTAAAIWPLLSENTIPPSLWDVP